jgi:hypothetical protein
VAAVALLCALGIPAVLAVDRRVRAGTLLGLSFLFGAGIAAVILLSLSLLRVPWSSGSFAAAALPLELVLLWLAFRRWLTDSEARVAPETGRFSPAGLALDLLTLIAVIGHGIYATLAPIGQWDFWSDWGLKAEVFWFHRGLDFRFLTAPENLFASPDYPPLLPLTMDFFSLVRGAWEDRWMGLLFTAFAAALLLVARDLFREELGSRSLASLATLAVAGPALVLWIGLAEGPVIALGSLALLMWRRALRRGGSSWMFGSLLLGLAALTKNEGMALVIAAGVGLWIAGAGGGRRFFFSLAPAVLIAAIWFVPASLHGLRSEHFSGPAVARLADRIAHPGPFWAAFRQARWSQPAVWLAALGALLLFRQSLPKERFLLTAVGLELLFFLFTYLVSPPPLSWRIHYSSERLVAQQTFTVAFLAAALLLRGYRRPESTPA